MQERIVVIDDTPEIVQLYEDLLTDEGYEVVGTFAMPPRDPSIVDVLEPDLIIMDWLFGREASGLQVLNLLKAYPPTAAIPLIVCTVAYREVGEVEDILVQRGVRVLHKPFSVDDLLMLIRQVLAGEQVVG